MSVDKLVDSTQLDADLTSVANAIRTKGGTSAQLAFPAEFISAIQAISGGGGGLKYETGVFTLDSDQTVSASGGIAIPHGLGEAPAVAIVFPKDTPEASGEPNRGYIWMDKPMGESTQYTSSSGTSSYPITAQYYVSALGPPLKTRVNVPTSDSYMIQGSSKPTATHLYLFRQASSTTWYAGDYRYFVCEKWW